MLKNLLLIAAGGALGSIGRYGLTLLASHLLIRAEWGTFAANALGSLLIGLLMSSTKNEYQLFAAVGLCGGFTTFSTFSSQSLQLLHSGQYAQALLYTLGSVSTSIGMVALGWYCQQRITT